MRRTQQQLQLPAHSFLFPVLTAKWLVDRFPQSEHEKESERKKEELFFFNKGEMFSVATTPWILNILLSFTKDIIDKKCI